MKAQLLGREMLQQQPANAKPERITTGQQHRAAACGHFKSQRLNRCLGLIGIDQLGANRQLMVQAAWGCNHSRPIHQLALGRSQARKASSGGADHMEHHSIVQAAWFNV